VTGTEPKPEQLSRPSQSAAEIAFVDFEQPDLDLERQVAGEIGLKVRIPDRSCQTEEEVLEAAKGADAIVLQYAPVTRTVMSQLPGLRIISVPQVGTNTIDLEAARELGIWVANVPDGNGTEVAAHTAAMALSLVRGLPRFDAAVRSGNWHYQAAGLLRRPSELTVGIIGLGQIGRLYAANMKPCVGRQIAYDPYLPPERWPDGIERCETLEDLLRTADIVSVHMPLTAETNGMMNAERFAMMKPGSIFINVGRGEIVDTAALVDALDNGPLAGAGMDVLPTEPPDPDDPLLRHEKVLLSPHAAFYSVESDIETRTRSVRAIAELLTRGRPSCVVIEGTR
jgi:D-3-phosphoglycerate dehydrogenase